MNKKYIFPRRRNCSKRDLPQKVNTLYFPVHMLLSVNLWVAGLVVLLLRGFGQAFGVVIVAVRHFDVGSDGKQASRQGMFVYRIGVNRMKKSKTSAS